MRSRTTRRLAIASPSRAERAGGVAIATPGERLRRHARPGYPSARSSSRSQHKPRKASDLFQEVWSSGWATGGTALARPWDHQGRHFTRYDATTASAAAPTGPEGFRGEGGATSTSPAKKARRVKLLVTYRSVGTPDENDVHRPLTATSDMAVGSITATRGFQPIVAGSCCQR